jgi:hypothetical protein
MWLNHPDATNHRHAIRDQPGYFPPYERYVEYLQTLPNKDDATLAYLDFANAQLESRGCIDDIKLMEFDKTVRDTFNLHGLAWWRSVCCLLDLPLVTPSSNSFRSWMRKLFFSQSRIEYHPVANNTSLLGPLFRLGRGVSRPDIRFDGKYVGIDDFEIQAASNFGHFNELNFSPKEFPPIGIHLERYVPQIDDFLTRWMNELPLFQVGFFKLGETIQRGDTGWMKRARRLTLWFCSDGVIAELAKTNFDQMDALCFQPIPGKGREQVPLLLQSPLCRSSGVLCLTLSESTDLQALKLCENLHSLRVYFKRGQPNVSTDARLTLIQSLIDSLPNSLSDLSIAYAGDSFGAPNDALDCILSQLTHSKLRNYTLRIYRPGGDAGFTDEIPFGVYINDSRRFLIC